MAEFTKVVSEGKRLCKECTKCDSCPIGFERYKRQLDCGEFIKYYPEETEQIIMQWSAEHPIMTNRRKFEEVFGKDLLKLCVVDPLGDVLKWLDEEYKMEKNK